MEVPITFLNHNSTLYSYQPISPFSFYNSLCLRQLGEVEERKCAWKLSELGELVEKERQTESLL